MAKRRKKAHTVKRRRTHHRSHLSGLDVSGIASLIVGAVGAGLLNKIIPTTIDAKIVAGGKIAIGLMLPMLVKDGKTKAMLQDFGYGFVAVGSLDLLKGMGVLSGTDGTGADDLLVQLNGDQSLLAGAEDLSIMNGASILAGDNGAPDDLAIVNGMDDMGY